MVYIALIFSFLFEMSFSNLISIPSLLTPLFTLTALVILYPYFKNKKINFIIICIIIGLLYDISFFTSTFITTISFGICGSLVVLAYNYISYSIYSSNILNIIVLILYRIISYILLCVVDYTSFNKNYLFEGIYNSIIINIIYGIILFIIIDKLSKIFNIRRAE